MPEEPKRNVEFDALVSFRKYESITIPVNGETNCSFDAIISDLLNYISRNELEDLVKITISPKNNNALEMFKSQNVFCFNYDGSNNIPNAQYWTEVRDNLLIQ